MGGSYVANTLEALNGELTIPLANGDQLKLHMSKVLLTFSSICSTV